MTARTHDMFALASLVTFASFYPPQVLNVPTLFACLIANIIGSLIPDMDQGSNRLWDLVPAGNFVGKIFRRAFLGHRTISHSILGFYLFFKFFEWFLPKLLNTGFVDAKLVFASIMIGIASHLIADGLTKDGIPLFFPFSFKVGFPPISQLRVRTGTWVENLVVLPGVVIYIIWFIGEKQAVFKSIVKTIAQ